MKIELPDEIYRKIYSYIFDLRELLVLKKRYLYDDRDDFVYRYENRYDFNSGYHWTQHGIVFPSIVSAYWFDKGFTEVCDYPEE
jgi:hypothetical protein